VSVESEQHVKNYVHPSALAQTRVSDVLRTDIQAFADELLNGGLAPGTVSNVLNPVQAFFAREVARDRLTVNPARESTSPMSVRADQSGLHPGRRQRVFLKHCPRATEPLWATAFYAGLRRGELQALRCSDVDLGASLISVERSWDQYEGPGDPKSESSRRTVPVLAVLRDYLDEHLLLTRRTDDDLVFGRTASSPFVPSVTDGRAKNSWEEAGLRPITPHECRHTFASLLIDAGANPKAIQTFMGHSKIQTTFDTYGHLMPGSHDEVRERMDAYLGAAIAAPAAA
jgi:integrase